VLTAEGQYAEAAAVLNEAIAIVERTLGSDNARAGGLRVTLGKALTKDGRFADAERELIEAHRVLASAQGVTASKIESSRKALVMLYEAWETAEPGEGYGERATEWR
jgi:tetratricopeptide (TPR) repeat protein